MDVRCSPRFVKPSAWVAGCPGTQLFERREPPQSRSPSRVGAGAHTGAGCAADALNASSSGAMHFRGRRWVPRCGRNHYSLLLRKSWNAPVVAAAAPSGAPPVRTGATGPWPRFARRPAVVVRRARSLAVLPDYAERGHRPLRSAASRDTPAHPCSQAPVSRLTGAVTIFRGRADPARGHRHWLGRRPAGGQGLRRPDVRTARARRVDCSLPVERLRISRGAWRWPCREMITRDDESRASFGVPSDRQVPASRISSRIAFHSVRAAAAVFAAWTLCSRAALHAAMSSPVRPCRVYSEKHARSSLDLRLRLMCCCRPTRCRREQTSRPGKWVRAAVVLPVAAARRGSRCAGVRHPLVHLHRRGVHGHRPVDAVVFAPLDCRIIPVRLVSPGHSHGSFTNTPRSHHERYVSDATSPVALRDATAQAAATQPRLAKLAGKVSGSLYVVRRPDF